MSDNLFSFPSGELSVRPGTDQFALLQKRIVTCLQQLKGQEFSGGVSEQIDKELVAVHSALESLSCGQLLVSELITANKFVVQKTDHRNVEVLRFGLQQLTDYLSNISASNDSENQDNAGAVLPALNELAAMHRRPLVSESLFVVPDVFRVDVKSLRVDEDNKTRENWYLEFSQLLLGIQRGENRTDKVDKLTGLLEQLADHASDQVAARPFWSACHAFVQSLEHHPAGELRPAVFAVFKQIEKAVMDALGGGQRPVLGMQEQLDKLLCNLLCYAYSDHGQLDSQKSSKGQDNRANDKKHHPYAEQQRVLNPAFGFSAALTELGVLRDRIDDSEDSIWIECSVAEQSLRLKLYMQQMLDGSYESIDNLVAQVHTLRQTLVLTGVHGADDNLQEVVEYLQQDPDADTLHSAVVSCELVEQQLLYQFGFLNAEAADSKDQSNVDSPQLDSQVDRQPDLSPSLPVAHSPVTGGDFVSRCNACIDVIQHALDTALGSSGNLIPDDSVVSALNKLNNIVVEENITPLTDLLTPLSEFLTDAQGTTLNQAETLLVQEAIIAATLGIDSLVSDNPMPELLSEVSERIELAAKDGSYRRGIADNADLQGNSFNGFLNEAEELQPRLFELYQRWRGAPDGANRLSVEINRLLHALKHSAEDVGQTSVASLAHYLESAMVDACNSETRPSQDYFDLALESVELLGDDIIRLRNSEPTADHGDLIDRLKLAGAVDSGATIRNEQTGIVHSSTTNDDSVDLAVSKEPVIFDQHTTAYQPVDWQAQFAKADTCYDQITRHHTQIIELQRQLEASLQKITAQSNPQTIGDIQLVIDDLEQATRRQSGSISQLNNALNGASEVAVDALSASLIDALSHSAAASGLQIRFQFTNSVGLLDRKMVAQIQQSLVPVLQGIVSENIEDAAERTDEDKPANATIEVCLAPIRSDGAIARSGLRIEIIDDGAGVDVDQPEHDETDPWRLATRVRTPAARSDQPARSHQLARQLEPTVWSRLNDQPIEVTSLIDFAAEYGGSVAIGSDSCGTRYRVTVPHLNTVQEVLLIEVEQQKLAIASNSVIGVAQWNGGKALPLAALIGIRKKSAFEKKDNYTAVQCSAARGQYTLLVDKVLEHHSVEITTAERLFPATVPGYSGAFINDEGQMVMLLDVEYWVTQGRSARYF